MHHTNLRRGAAVARRAGAWLALAAILLVCACGAGREAPAVQDLSQIRAVSLSTGDKLHVVATTGIVGDVVAQVGGDAIDRITLMGTGVDPHTYVATPSDSAAIHNAHVLFANGAGLEEGLSELALDSSGGAVRIRLCDYVDLLPAVPGSEHAGEPDPHAWFDVQIVVHWTQTIAEALSALDPANAGRYRQNAAAYTRELESLDAWIVEQVSTIPADRRRLVTNHEALGYFAQRYGFELVGAVYPLSPSSEPSAQDLAALEEAIRTYGLSVLFTEGTVSPVLADQVARDTGVRLVSLYTGSLGGPGSGAESYPAMMRYNVQAIVSALR